MFGLGDDQSLRLLYLVLLLVFLVGTGWGWSRGRGNAPSARFGGSGFNLRHLAVWALIALALVTVYAYRAPLQRFAAPVLRELDPSRVVQVTNADGTAELAVARGADGHFHIDAEANGTPVSFLVDTGASTTVLTLGDAERVGIDVASLAFDRPVQTANGIAMFARADLESLTIGPYRLSGVSVGIMPEGALETSLLGMSTINRFAGWRVDGDRMVLTP
jgi:aspartyl protease family protein